MRRSADNLLLYRACGLAALLLTLISGAMAVTGRPGMWITAAVGCIEAFGFGAIVARSIPSPPPARGREAADG